MDVIALLRQRALLPIAACQVSGEYALMKFAAASSAVEEERVVRESLGAFKRAGVDLILTHIAVDIARQDSEGGGHDMIERQRTLLLTGASRGIGHATVKTFSDAGWRVLTISRHPFDPRCPWEGGAKNHIQLDLADMENVLTAMPRVREIVGDQLDALINNAAISPKSPEGGKITALEMGYSHWLHIFNVNFFACVALVQGLRAPLEAARGVVVNMTSIVGSRVHPFASAAYATSKAALWALTRELAADFGASGVRVNAVSPGEINTGILSPGTEAIVERNIPLHRLGVPREVADLLLFLCSPPASYISGSEIHIDGGQRV